MNEQQIKILYHIDERTNNILQRLDGFEESYVKKDEFAVMQRILYGIMLGFISTVSAYMLTSILDNSKEENNGKNSITRHDNLSPGRIEWNWSPGRSE